MTPESDPLAQVAILAELDAEARGEVAAQCRFHRYAKGATVLDRADSDNDIVFCLDGRIEVTIYGAGGRAVSFTQLGPGDHVGELAAIDGGPRSADAVALAPTRAARLGPAALKDAAIRNPSIAWRLLTGLAGVIRTLDTRVMDLNTRPANLRVIRELLRLARPGPGPVEPWIIAPLPTQAQIAARADVTRETVARVLGELREDGIARKDGKRLVIDDRPALDALLAEDA